MNQAILFFLCLSFLTNTQDNSGSDLQKINRPGLDVTELHMLDATHKRPAFFSTVTPTFYETQINANDLTQTASVMYTISNSGRYYLANDIFITTSAPAATPTIIQITASNVVLNLNSHIITKTSGTATGAIAIEIGTSSSAVSNVTIFNGYINSIDSTGIKINKSCDNIFINAVKVNNCSLGLTATGNAGAINNVEIRDSTFTNCTASSTTDAFGAKLDTCKNVIISRSFFNNNSQTGTVTGNGLWLTGCTDCYVTQCGASSNSGPTAYGFRIDGTSKSCLFDECTAEANSSTTGECCGFSIDSSNANKFVNCRASTNTAATNSYGFRITSANYNTFLQSNAINQTVSSTGNAFGFRTATGTGTKFYNCLSMGNTGGSTAGSSTSARATLGSLGIGFELGSSSVCETIEQCKAIANNGGSGAGIGISVDGSSSSKHTVFSNEIYVNTGTFASYGYRDFTATQTTTFLAKNVSAGQGLISPGASANPTLTASMNYMWNATGISHNANDLTVEPINLTRMDQIDSTFSFQNVSASET